MKKYFQKRFINFLVHDLFNTIDERDILEEKNGIVMYQGKPMDAEMKIMMRNDAQTYSKSVLWEVLSNEVKYLSNLRMFEKGKNEEDLIMGKAFLYALEVMNKK